MFPLPAFFSNPVVRKIVPYAAIVVIVMAVYAPSLNFQFVGFDENDHITSRLHFLQDVKNIPAIFTHDAYYPTGTSLHYRPLLTLSFMADAAMYDARPLGYHLTNVVLHILVVVFFFCVLQALGIRKTAALTWALVFAVHPAIRQTIAWVPGRNDSLLAIFLLVSFLFFLKFIRSGRWPMLVLTGVFFALGMFTKETAIAFPFICLGYLLIFDREAMRRRWEALAATGAGIMVVWFFARANALTGTEAPATLELLRRTLSYTIGLLHYVRVAVIPINLSVMPTVHVLDVWLGALVLVIIVFAVWYGRRFWRWFIFGAIWFLAFLVPTLISSETPTRMAFFEFRLYLPLMGLCIALASVSWEHYIKNTRVRVGIVIILVGMLAGTTVYTSRDLRDDAAFWQNAVSTSPMLARAHDGLGVSYGLHGMFNEALREHERAKELAPNDKRISNNIGVILLRLQRVSEAEAAFKDEVALNPTYVVAHHNLALTYAIQGKLGDAEKEWLIAVQLNPQYPLPHQGLAILYAQQGKTKQSLVHIAYLRDLGVTLIPELQAIWDQFERATTR